MRIAAWHCLRGGPAETTVLGSFWDTAPLGAGLGFRGKSGLGVTARQRQQSGQDGEDSSRSLLHRLQAAAAAEGRAAGRSCRGLPLRRRSPGAPSAPSESGTPAAREDARSHPAPHVVSGGSGLSASLPVTAAPPQGEDRPPLSKASRKGGWGGWRTTTKKACNHAAVSDHEHGTGRGARRRRARRRSSNGRGLPRRHPPRPPRLPGRCEGRPAPAPGGLGRRGEAKRGQERARPRQPLPGIARPWREGDAGAASLPPSLPAPDGTHDGPGKREPGAGVPPAAVPRGGRHAAPVSLRRRCPPISTRPRRGGRRWPRAGREAGAPAAAPPLPPRHRPARRRRRERRRRRRQPTPAHVTLIDG